MFRNDEKHLKKTALGVLCLFLLWVALHGSQVRHNAASGEITAAKATSSTTPETHKTLHQTVSGKLHRTLREAIQGRAVADMWSHRVWISPCHWSQRKTLRANMEEDSHQIFRCNGMKVEIVDEELRVNEKNYGKLSKGVVIWVVNGKVFIDDKEVQPLTQIAQN